MSRLHLDVYSTMMKEVSGNLKSEIEELSKKVKQARETENWGTYKNLILAYKEIVKMYNDIALDVCEIDTDKTQYVETKVSLDNNTSGIITKMVEGVLSNNCELTPSGFIRKSNQTDIKTVSLFDEWDIRSFETKIENDSVMINANMSKLLSRKLIGCDNGVLINVKGFRNIGKTYSLIKFAKEFNYLVIVPNEFVANSLKKECDYEYIYSQKNNLLNGIEIKDCVIDEGVDIEKIKELGINIVTGYIRK